MTETSRAIPGTGLQQTRPLACPSAHPDTEGAVIFGVVDGTAAEPRIAYLGRSVTPTPEILALAGPTDPAAVFRFGGPCAENACRHFGAGRCSLGERLVQLLPVASDRLAPCALRPACRWWHEQGPAACHRCPLVVTANAAPSAELARAAQPPPDPDHQPAPGQPVQPVGA